jgi:hypothetical protein
MEEDMMASSEIKVLVQNDIFAQALYASMCNQQWRKANTRSRWSCSWRHAGGIVADLRAPKEDYLDYYCSGMRETGVQEGTVSGEIKTALAELGWRPLTNEEVKEEHQEVLVRISELEQNTAPTQEWRGNFYRVFEPNLNKASGRLHALALHGKISEREYYNLCNKLDYHQE